MKGYLLAYVTLLCVIAHIIQGAPNHRITRDVSAQEEGDISPVNIEVSLSQTFCFTTRTNKLQ